MAQIKGPKGSPTIDMTPMVDLAFLLVTFFMLSANFRSDEPVVVDTPSSIASNEMPKNMVQITIDKGGRVYFGYKGTDNAKDSILMNMSAKYGVGFTDEQYKKFRSISSFGCKIQELPQYLDSSPEERQKFGSYVPVDSVDNQLMYWIVFSKNAGINAKEDLYSEALIKNPAAVKNDFETKFILKADGKALYAHAKNVIETFRDLEICNLNFITSLEGSGEEE